MKSRAVLASLFLGAALVLSSAQNADAFGLFGGGGCGCEPSCGFEPSCACEPSCGFDHGHGCCDAPRRGCCLSRLFDGLRRGRGHGCCEASCCAPEPTCCAPEPTCCAPEPSCGFEADCCEPACGCAPKCRILSRLGGLFRRGGHHGCCEPTCGCEPSCGIMEPSCGCN